MSLDLKDLLPSAFISISCVFCRPDDHRCSSETRPEIIRHPVIAEGRKGGEHDLDKIMGEQLSGQSFLFHHH